MGAESSNIPLVAQNLGITVIRDKQTLIKLSTTTKVIIKNNNRQTHNKKNI